MNQIQDCMIQKILIVDDEASIRKSLVDVLSFEDYELAVAKDAEDALQQLEVSTFDLVISDIKMPKMDGIELLGAIRAKWPKLLVILMSGHENDASKLKTLGAYDFLPKPLDLMHLLDVLETAVPLGNS
jgi:two-component system nitrogen regulation response regulator NtrX